MSEHVLLTRPAENTQATKRLLEQRGYKVTSAPLLVCESLEIDLPEGLFDGFIITSVHAAVGLSRITSGRDDKPVFVTGAATQQAVIDDGWRNVVNVEGGALDVVRVLQDRVPAMRNVLYPCATQTAHHLDDLLGDIDIKCVSWPVYRMNEVDEFPSDVQDALVNGDIDHVLLYSARTAAVFVRLTTGTFLETVSILTLSEDIARALGEPLANKAVYPAKKTEKALLSLLDKTKSLTAQATLR